VSGILALLRSSPLRTSVIQIQRIRGVEFSAADAFEYLKLTLYRFHEQQNTFFRLPIGRRTAVNSMGTDRSIRGH
jgi:hypothetical protein